LSLLLPQAVAASTALRPTTATDTRRVRRIIPPIKT
jgi:hypothetical protein